MCYNNGHGGDIGSDMIMGGKGQRRSYSPRTKDTSQTELQHIPFSAKHRYTSFPF